MGYNVVGQIGEGGFGVVEKVEDESGRLWAKKSFKDPKIPDIGASVLQKRFEREVRCQSQLNHPNVVKIIDSGLACDPPFFIMELADGSLLEEIKADHTLAGNPNQALFDVLAGLEEIHSLGIAHRDLKPGNILRFTDSDGSKRYAISDFGLMIAAESQSTTLTQSNFWMGTVPYAPPECVSNFKGATTQSDIYSFGAILHDIFSGDRRIPYSELSSTGPIGPVIEKATKKLRSHRYKDIAELRVDLYEALNQETLTFSSDEEADIIQLLQVDRDFSYEEWEKILLVIENLDEKEAYLGNIFRYISTDHIDLLSKNAPDFLAILGRFFCKYVQDSSFDFDYCDVLGSKVAHFHRLGATELKALAILALLKMGTNHNRWFVERLFSRLAGTDLPDEVAERVKIEVEIQEELNFEEMISHLENSISASRDHLHPVLLGML